LLRLCYRDGTAAAGPGRSRTHHRPGAGRAAGVSRAHRPGRDHQRCAALGLAAAGVAGRPRGLAGRRDRRADGRGDRARSRRSGRRAAPAQARVELRAFLERIGPVEIISDAPLWDWPLLVWLAGPEGLPDGVTAGRIGEDIEYEFDDLGYEPPHHALEDARLLAALLG